MKVALVRGAFLAQFETQIYYPLVDRIEIVAFSSLNPYQDIYPFELIKLPSPMDINFGAFGRLKMPILNRLFVDAHLLFGLESKLKGFDIAHTAETFYGYTNQCLSAKKMGSVKAVVSTVFENIPFNNEGIRGRKGFKQRAIREVDRFIAISERSKDALVVEGCPEEKISVITQHIDTSRFKPQEFKNISPHREITILFAGRVEFYKGIYEIVYAAKMLVKKLGAQYKLSFMIVGNGSEKQKVVQLVNKLGLNKNFIFSELTYDKMHTVYKSADIFVAPSRATRTYQEQFSTVLLEAQASGLPIVTTYHGGIPENVENCALMANPGDFYSIAEKLKEFIENPDLRKKFGIMARKHAVNKFDIRLGARRIERVYEEVLKEAARRKNV